MGISPSGLLQTLEILGGAKGRHFAVVCSHLIVSVLPSSWTLPGHRGAGSPCLWSSQIYPLVFAMFLGCHPGWSSNPLSPQPCSTNMLSSSPLHPISLPASNLGNQFLCRQCGSLSFTYLLAMPVFSLYHKTFHSPYILINAFF